MVPSFRDMQQHRGRRRNRVGAAQCSNARTPFPVLGLERPLILFPLVADPFGLS